MIESATLVRHLANGSVGRVESTDEYGSVVVTLPSTNERRVWHRDDIEPVD